MTLLGDFVSDLDFSLDDFQLRACESIAAGRGVVVCAPTGAGKTIVGEFAVHAALHDGGKCFYTTPIKALSNQKYHDLVEDYGEEKVGLLTGDVSINGGADIVVMTTEVLRNMIYAGSPTLKRLTHVVMDEIHYLADRERGAVWEEVILNLDQSVSVIGLSATVSNSEEFGNWLSTVRGHTDVIVTDLRPVPLEQHMLVGQRLYPLFERGRGRAGSNAVDSENLVPEVNRDLLEACQRAEFGYGDAGRKERYQYKRRGRSEENAPNKRFRPARRGDVVRMLGALDMLPAIVFIFSRAGCEGALHQVGMTRMELTSAEEQEQIAAIMDAGVADIPEDDLRVLGYLRWRRIVLRGFAAHHAGMLPAFRHIVEKLFNKGLVKVVFATETLALGINMPARTVVLEKLVKYNGEAHVDLTPGQYTQMTGRAGRRGIDTQGHAVVQWAPAMDPRAVAGLASTRTYPLISTFAPSYNMSVNLLRTLGYDDAKKMMERSFAQYQADGDIVGDVAELERAKAKAAGLKAELLGLDKDRDTPDGTRSEYADFNITDVLEYLDIRNKLSQEEKNAKRRNIEDRHTETVNVLRLLRRGEVIPLPVGKKVQLAVVVREDNSRTNPRPSVISVGGFTGRIDAEMFPAAPEAVGRIKLPRDANRHPRRAIGMVRSEIDRKGLRGPKRLKRRSAVRSPVVKQLRAELRAHPLHRDPVVDAIAAEADALRRAEASVARLQKRVDNASDTLARTFDRVLQLLAEMSYVEWPEGEKPYVSEEGEKLAMVHSGSDLLAAQCLRRGIWDGLDPAELAGAASALVFENRRSVQGSDEVPTEPLAEALGNTFRLWEELSADERRYRLPVTDMPDIAFATAIHQWTAGAPLGYCLQAAAECGAELTPGDFVRWCRQVIDLLEQIKKTGYSREIRDSAAEAVQAIRRGVVALGN